MLTLNDGRTELWQWDTGRKLLIDVECSQVHFSNRIFGRSIDVDVLNGIADIPDFLLQSDNDLNAWIFVGTPENGYTQISKTFKVNKRPKPNDYVFTPFDQKTIPEMLEDALTEAKESGEFDGKDGKDGKDGADGLDGKGAYEYAQEGGYLGTEEEFASKLASPEIQVDADLNKPGEAADAAIVGIALQNLNDETDDAKERLTGIEKEIADLKYKAITIKSFTNNIETVEKGSVIAVSDIIFAWSLSKKPETLTINGVAIPAEQNGSISASEIITGTTNITQSKTWILEATDEREAFDTKPTTVNFYNGVYYGASTEPNEYNSAFIMDLEGKKLRNNKLPSFTANAGAREYLYYCLPVSYGACSFIVGGFEGGIGLVATIEFTNSLGHKEDYYIYKSDNASLGATVVTIS